MVRFEADGFDDCVLITQFYELSRKLYCHCRQSSTLLRTFLCIFTHIFYIRLC